MKESLRIGLLPAVVALVYGNTLRNEFTMDDGIYVLRNPQVTSASVQALFSANKLTNLFRPVTFGTLALNWKLGAARPFGFHLFNLIAHAAVCLLLYLLLRNMLGASLAGKSVAFTAALVFAVHPIHT